MGRRWESRWGRGNITQNILYKKLSSIKKKKDKNDELGETEIRGRYLGLNLT